MLTKTRGYFLMSTEFRKADKPAFWCINMLARIQNKTFPCQALLLSQVRNKHHKIVLHNCQPDFFLHIIQPLCYSQNHSVKCLSSDFFSMFDYTTSSWFKDHWNKLKHSYSLQMKSFYLNHRDGVRKSNIVWPSADCQCSQRQICRELGAPSFSPGDVELALSYCKQYSLYLKSQRYFLFALPVCSAMHTEEGRWRGFCRYWEIIWATVI